ncbi:pentapeptide repeat-containing protein [Nostoc sp. CALU 1950]|uniref:pentapeptide repeat-containing protein n=1 Tax=Nostoc sp. CALU 1950 TaxID=3104321 RepID=UPI003EC0099E
MPQDFSCQNLRGRSFKGQNLEGANFSGADICSADFTGANLRGVNFSHAKAGLQWHWIIGLVIVILLLSVLSGLISAYSGLWLAYLLVGDAARSIGNIPGLIVLILCIIFVIFSLNIGFTTALGVLTGAFALAVAMAGAAYMNFPNGIWVAMAFYGCSFGLMGVPFILAFAVASSNVLVRNETVAVALALIGSICGITVGFLILDDRGNISGATATHVLGLIPGCYMAKLALADHQKYTPLKTSAIFFTAIGGTSFRSADLIRADFMGATLKSTDFRNATLTCTRFHQAKMLSFVRPGKSYLQKVQVRQLLITGQGEDKNFDRQDLHGVNLQGANLIDTSFIGADLSEANLQDADLSRAKLIQTQLDETDLTGATLTGACIEDWGITSHTKLYGVRCEYVFMRSPTPDDPNPRRKPDNWNETFADGDFADFIKPIVDTLDLYHNSGVDPRAIAISFKQLAENHPNAELEIVAMEKRGQDKFLLRAKTATTAEKSQLSAEYFDTYNEIKALPEREIKLLLAEKDSRIRSLENFVNQALQRPSYYSNVEQVGTMTNNPGGFSVDGSVGGNINNVQGEGNSVVQGDTTMTGDRTINTGGGNYNERIERDYIQGNYYAAGQPQSLAEAAAEIQQLLKQLEQTYPTTTTSQQMVVAAEAINRIESNPTLKKRVINAVKEGGLAAFEKAIDNPAGAFIVGAVKGWQEVEAED